MREILRQTREEHTTQRNYGSFILCILSQGDCKKIDTADGEILYLNEIIDLLDSNNFPAMAGKPKFIFLDLSSSSTKDGYDKGLKVPSISHVPMVTGPQASINIVTDRSSPNHPASQPALTHSTQDARLDQHKVPYKSDIIICHAAFLYYPAFHHNQLGSVATRVLAEVLCKHAHDTHLVDMLFKVRRKIAAMDISGRKQVCTTVDTLTKDFYLFPNEMK